MIFDACTLMSLDTPTGVRSPDGKEHTYLEVLPFLAQQGYHIVIPEMVAYEIGDVLAGGLSTSKVFTNGNAGRYETTEMHEFLTGVSNGVYENMEITPTTSPLEVKRYMDDIRVIVARADTCKNAVDRKVLRDEISAVNARSKEQKGSDYRRHFGDKAIIAYVSALPNDSTESVYVISDDIGELQEVAQSAGRRNITLCTTDGMIEALVNSHLSQKTGVVRKDAAAATLNHARNAACKYDKHRGRKSVIDCDAYAMANLGASAVVHRHDTHGPLFSSFGELKQHMDRGEPKPWVARTATPPATSATQALRT